MIDDDISKLMIELLQSSGALDEVRQRAAELVVVKVEIAQGGDIGKREQPPGKGVPVELKGLKRCGEGKVDGKRAYELAWRGDIW